MALKFNKKTTTQDWTTFLQTLTETSLTFKEKLVICPTPIMYPNRNVKNLWVQTARKEAATGTANGEMSNIEGIRYLENWTSGLSLSTFQTTMRSTGTLAVFSNAIGNAIDQQSERVVSWHTYAIFYKDGILAIYDPGFIPRTDRFDSCTNIALAKALVKSLKGKGTNRRITEIWIGGGGNKGTRCQEMTRKWLEQEINIAKGEELGDWKERAGWMRVLF